MTWEKKIIEYINRFPGATDKEIADYYKVSNQQINSPARNLERKGLLVRRQNYEKDGLIGNFPTGIVPEEKPLVYKKASVEEPLQEEEIKHVLTDKLKAEGWDVKTAWGNTRGVDIDARRGSDRWLIEIKGPGSRNPMLNKYFVSILGELLQRMDDHDARYTIALPDIDKYRRLWRELPRLAKERTTIDIMFVDKDGNINYGD